ncbi:SAM-dependent methyltransferase [Paenibacillus sp. RU4T]|uniref:SAM-dependent methyltransferase n=1 Tax=Paenibacillus sp. RU4T TaxID=1907394 RepID=UPI000970CFCD
MVLTDFHRTLSGYADAFALLADAYDGTAASSSELEALIDRYSALILEPRNALLWEELTLREPEETERLAERLRERSAACVALMEKYRALKLLDGAENRTGYFRNIEACIEEEFGSFAVTRQSRVLMIGSGSFPMTPLLIARRTGAQVVGIDIDPEAVELGRKVAGRLGPELPIRLETSRIEQLEGLKAMTHIIFSSTIPVKYELLERLHPLAGEHAVVAMRYGGGLKSLFNYPDRHTEDSGWRLAETVLRPGQIFDIALYRKAAEQDRLIGGAR